MWNVIYIHDLVFYRQIFSMKIDIVLWIDESSILFIDYHYTKSVLFLYLYVQSKS